MSGEQASCRVLEASGLNTLKYANLYRIDVYRIVGKVGGHIRMLTAVNGRERTQASTASFPPGLGQAASRIQALNPGLAGGLKYMCQPLLLPGVSMSRELEQGAGQGGHRALQCGTQVSYLVHSVLSASHGLHQLSFD